MLKVYGDIQSGNCYKVKLLLSFMQIPHEWIHTDILAGDTQTDVFKRMNPNGKIPLLHINESTVLVESNAILHFLADDTPWLPTDRLLHAKVLQWQFFEQYSHEPYIAVARFINKYLGLPEERKDEYEAKQFGGHKALVVMEQQLAQTEFLVGNNCTIADITLFAYTHVAHEGGFDLSSYPNIQRWLAGIKAMPNYVNMANE